jgi:hypothetical protein
MPKRLRRRMAAASSRWRASGTLLGKDSSGNTWFVGVSEISTAKHSPLDSLIMEDGSIEEPYHLTKLYEAGMHNARGSSSRPKPRATKVRSTAKR